MTAVPCPGADSTSTVPPTRAMRSLIEYPRPYRPAGTSAGSKPRPQSTIETATSSARRSTRTSAQTTPEWAATLRNASRAAPMIAWAAARHREPRHLGVHRRGDRSGRFHGERIQAVDEVDRRGVVAERRHRELFEDLQRLPRVPREHGRAAPDGARGDHAQRGEHRVVHLRSVVAFVRPARRLHHRPPVLAIPLGDQGVRPSASAPEQPHEGVDHQGLDEEDPHVARHHGDAGHVCADQHRRRGQPGELGQGELRHVDRGAGQHDRPCGLVGDRVDGDEPLLDQQHQRHDDRVGHHQTGPRPAADGSHGEERGP